MCSIEALMHFAHPKMHSCIKEQKKIAKKLEQKITSPPVDVPS